MIAATKTDSKNNFPCSFCGKTEKDVEHIIAGPGVFICNECVGLCQEIIEEKDEPEAFSPGSEVEHAENGTRAVIDKFHDTTEPFYTVRIDDKIEQWPAGDIVLIRSAEDIANAAKVEADEKARIARNTKRADEIRTKVDMPDSILRGTVLSFAYELGYEAPKPGLSPEELAVLVRIVRAAPTDDVEAYVEGLRRDVSAWDQATRKTINMGQAAVLASVVMGSLGSMLMGGFGR